VGDIITFTIVLHNDTGQPVSGIRVWDTLPIQVVFAATSFEDAPVQIKGNYIMWDIGYKAGNTGPFVLYPGQTETIRFEVKITGASAETLPVGNTAYADYEDLAYFPGSPNGDRHPPVSSGQVFFPRGRIAVFPNPFKPSADKSLKFDNMTPGSVISLYSLSGEHIKTIESPVLRAYWDGKNRYGNEVSAGVYFYTVKNPSGGQMIKGKVFVVR